VADSSQVDNGHKDSLTTIVPTLPFAAVPETLVVQWEKNARLGDILTDPQGRTVYTYKDDRPDQSVCTSDCIRSWPPVTINKGWQPVAGPRVPGTVGAIARSDGTYQVTYDGAPLYQYSGDINRGATNGQGVDNLWYVVQVTPSPTTTRPTP